MAGDNGANDWIELTKSDPELKNNFKDMVQKHKMLFKRGSIIVA